jgi:SAM-dependent methyltransferase
MVRRQVAISRDPGAADSDPLKLDNPLVVQWEYASEERLAARNAAYRDLVEGIDAEELTFELVAAAAPARMLEVGCGMGELSERVARELGVSVTAVDFSERMVELSRARGVDAQLGDAQNLPFEDGTFDVAVANWVLYHLPDVDRGVGELARVLTPAGTLIAASVGAGNMEELWSLVGDSASRELSFGAENGAEILSRRFRNVERHDAIGTVVFPDVAAVRRFVAMTITRAHLADRVPDFEGELRTRSAHVVFVAREPR